MARVTTHRVKLFSLLLLTKVVLDQPFFIGHYRKTSVRIDDARSIVTRLGNQVCIAPEVTQFHSFAADNKQAGLGANCFPPLARTVEILFAAQIGETGVQSLAYDVPLPQLYFVDSMWCGRIPAIAQVVN